MHLMYTLNENGDRVYTLKVLGKFSIPSPGLSPFGTESNDGGQDDKICASRSAQASPLFVLFELKDRYHQPDFLRMINFLVTESLSRRGTASFSPNGPQNLGSTFYVGRNFRMLPITV